jgi:hypothetical protein
MVGHRQNACRGNRRAGNAERQVPTLRAHRIPSMTTTNWTTKIRTHLTTAEDVAGFAVAAGLVAAVTGGWPFALVGLVWLALAVASLLWPKKFLEAAEQPFSQGPPSQG